MRSRADGAPPALRVAAERTLRAAALLLLALGLWRFLHPERADAAATESADARALPQALARWSTRPVQHVYARLDSAPDAATRAWLAALRRAGASVAWGPRVPPAIALAAEPARDPAGGVRVRVAAPTGSRLVLRDAAGVIDTLVAANGGASLALPSASDTLAAAIGGTVARAVAADSLRLGRVLVLGRVGWESKFVIAALEERGWQVSARLALSPTRSVTQGPALALDTARFAAVVMLDASAAEDAGRVARFVRTGGGVVLAGDATSIAALAALAPGAQAAREPGAVGPLPADDPRRGLSLAAVARLQPDAAALERRSAGDRRIAVAARRAGAGRVVQVGYDDSWRWRMSGGDGAPEAHRAWWARVVGAAAYAPAVDRPSTGAAAVLDAAPAAQLVASLGPPTGTPAGTLRPVRAARLPHWLPFALAALALLAEWTSRRTRGAR